MSKPLHTRPFDMSAAKAGAPFSLACGWPVHIIKYDMRDGKCPILGLYGEQDQIGRWTAEGVFLGGGHSSLHLVMTPLGYLDGKPVFVGDILESYDPDKSCSATQLAATARTVVPGCWRWPEPEKVYPVTTMLGRNIFNSVAEKIPRFGVSTESGEDSRCREPNDVLVESVNSGLRHFIDNLGVMPDNCALRAKLKGLGWIAPEGGAA